MDIYVAIVESTDYDGNGYAFDQIVGCFGDEKTAYETAQSFYTNSIRKDEYGYDSVTGYRVDIYKLGVVQPPIFGSTHWVDQDGTEHEQRLH